MNDEKQQEPTPLKQAERDMNAAFNIIEAVNRGDDQWAFANPWYRRLFGLKPKPVHDSHELRMARTWAKKYIDWCAEALAHELAMALGEEVVPVHPAHARDMERANRTQKAPFRPEGIAEAQGGGGGGPSSPLVQALDEVDEARKREAVGQLNELVEMQEAQVDCEHDWAATGHDDIHRCTKCKMHIGYDPHRVELCIPHDWQTRVAGGIECSRCGATLDGVTAGEVERE